jgi:redox-sensitive bicupin YhaK (pirin superfamily)
MIALRRAKERHHDRRREREVWLTFYPHDRAGPFAAGFGALAVLDEDRLSPGTGVPCRPDHDAEIVTYVRDGALAYDDAAGASGVLRAGELQGSRLGETNPSRTDWAHVFQIWLRPAQVGLAPSREQKRFSAAERRGGLCVVASHDARKGSLHFRQDALLYSAMLSPGTHVVHELGQARNAWLHVVAGAITLGDLALSTGDGAGFTAERAVSFTAREETEVLLVDMGAAAREQRGEVR